MICWGFSKTAPGFLLLTKPVKYSSCSLEVVLIYSGSRAKTKYLVNLLLLSNIILQQSSGKAVKSGSKFRNPAFPMYLKF